MSGDGQMTGHLQDIVKGLYDVERSVREQPQTTVEAPLNVMVVNVPSAYDQKALDPQPPPVVNVTVPVPVVNVSAPAVTVEVSPPLPVAYRITVTDRDDSGLIRSFVIAPIV